MTRKKDPGRFWLTMLVPLAILAAFPARAQTPTCDALAPPQAKLARELFSALHPYAGCDETFERCLAARPTQPVVRRLAEDLCRQVKAGRSREEIERALARRAQSMMPLGKPAPVTQDEATRVGPPDAPVAVVVFACARCPFCSVVVPALHRVATEGPLAGKLRLYFRDFPLKDHPGSIEGGLALLAAARLGQFWPFILQVYRNYDRFCPKLFSTWAAEAGMDPAAFEQAYADPQTREALAASKQEGIRSRVEATPTLFVNGRRYVYEATVEAILDVLAEEVERLETRNP